MQTSDYQLRAKYRQYTSSNQMEEEHQQENNFPANYKNIGGSREEGKFCGWCRKKGHESRSCTSRLNPNRRIPNNIENPAGEET
jgi:hypothetical protein